VIKLALLALAAASATSSPALMSSAPWWEKVTITIAGDGNPQSCRYESSRRAQSAQSCEVDSGAATGAGGHSASDLLTRITFERRFSPGAAPASGALEPGDKLIGQQVVALAIVSRGAVSGCKVVATSGEMTPEYGCDDASAERFEASAKRSAAAEPKRGYMTVLVYGHEEHVV
jgi:hypothetical protein